MTQVRLPHNWAPQRHQLAPWQMLTTGATKRMVLNWHRRAGKDDIFLHFACYYMHQHVCEAWHLLPQQEQARKAIWKSVNDVTKRRRIFDVFPEELIARNSLNKPMLNEQEMTITFKNGSLFRLVGSDNYHSLVGSQPKLANFSEYSRSDPAAWDYIQPMLEANDGVATFNSTPFGRNHFHELYTYAERNEDWHAETRTARDTDVFDHEHLERIRQGLIEKDPVDGETVFNQEYLCSWNSPRGGSVYGPLVFKMRQNGQVAPMLIDPRFPIYCAWDLGAQDATAVWFFQRDASGTWRFVDYYEDNNKTVAEHLDAIRERRHRVAGHILPHDANQREKLKLKTYQDEMRELCPPGTPIVVNPVRPTQSTLDLCKAELPLSRFNTLKCARGIKAVEAYHRSYNDTHRVYSDKPVHDWSSHACSAMAEAYAGWNQVDSIYRTAIATPASSGGVRIIRGRV